MYPSECEFDEWAPHIRLRESYAKGLASSRKSLRHQAVAAWYQWSKPRAVGSLTVPMHTIWSNKSGDISELLPEKPVLFTVGTEFAYPSCEQSWQPQTGARLRASTEAEKIITCILHAAIDADLRDDNEPAPTPEVIGKMAPLIYGADRLLDSMPRAQVSTFYGEINVTWRAGDWIVRVACFQNRPTVVQIGTLSGPIGHYRSEANPTPSSLAEKLRALVS